MQLRAGGVQRMPWQGEGGVMKKRCRYCRRKISDQRNTCASCVHVLHKYDDEQSRQAGRAGTVAKWFARGDNGGAVPPVRQEA